MHGYNRIGRLARGEFMVLLQDDNVPPHDGTWLHQALALFRRYPRLGAIGMQSYRFCIQGGCRGWL